MILQKCKIYVTLELMFIILGIFKKYYKIYNDESSLMID